VRDEEGCYWSLSWQPTAADLDSYECRHGMGYTIITTEFRGIRGEIAYFVPLDDDLEVWRVRLANRRPDSASLKVFSYVELCLGHALIDLINQPNDQHFNVVRFDPRDQAIYATKNYWVRQRSVSVKQPNEGWDRCVFFTTSLPVAGWDGSKDGFIGRWRSESNPIGVERGELGNTDITAGDACGALASDILLAPAQEIEFVVLLGSVETEGYREKAVEIMRKYLDIEKVDREIGRVRAYWEDYLSSPLVETPDSEMNLMLNIWGKRQAWVTFNMNRNAGYYHGGLLFGVGVRDQCQDLLGPLLSEPDAVAERICEVLSHQFADGSTLHNYFRLTGEGEKTGHSDTPLWLPFAVINYLKETADWPFLDRVVRYQDEGEGRVLDHIIHAVQYAIGSLTKNHLPRFGPGDWNDTLDYVGRQGIGESVWVAHFLCYILREMADLLDYLTDHVYREVDEAHPSGVAEAESISINRCYDIAATFRAEYEKIARAINSRCWDGEWYIRGTRDDGEVIGSSRNEEGRIFMNAQSWAVISGTAPPYRANIAMDSAYRLLNTARGPKILAPSYTKVDSGIGLATRCVPGKKENGAIFNHVAAWAILAEALLGNGDWAYEYYRKTIPMLQAADPDVYKMEPYVYCEYVTSPDHPTFGQGSHSWLTGSAVWMLRAGLDYILGIRPTYDGLLIDPSIPHEWDGYRIIRRFRGAIYEIEVRNPKHVQHGVTSIELNGRPVEGRNLPVLPAGAVGQVNVTLG